MPITLAGILRDSTFLWGHGIDFTFWVTTHAATEMSWPSRTGLSSSYPFCHLLSCSKKTKLSKHATIYQLRIFLHNLRFTDEVITQTYTKNFPLMVKNLELIHETSTWKMNYVTCKEKRTWKEIRTEHWFFWLCPIPRVSSTKYAWHIANMTVNFSVQKDNIYIGP